MSLRLYVDVPLHADLEFPLPPDAARHVQVRRLQPGDALVLFDGRGGEWAAQVLRMGKRDVDVRVGEHVESDRELPFTLEIALGMPANERMDSLVEKATELGVASIQPLLCERSVLRLDGERAQRRVDHWQAVAAAAAEQSGRTRVPRVHEIRTLAAWMATIASDRAAHRCVMSAPRNAPEARLACDDDSSQETADDPTLSSVEVPSLQVHVRAIDSLGTRPGAWARWVALSGPEGGLSAEEEAAAVAHGFARVSLGSRTLRADTAPLAWLAQMAVLLAI